MGSIKKNSFFYDETCGDEYINGSGHGSGSGNGHGSGYGLGYGSGHQLGCGNGYLDSCGDASGSIFGYEYDYA